MCRFCGAPLVRTFVDLGKMPLANSYLRSPTEVESERVYPLHVRVCDNCLLVQVDTTVPPEHLFTDYSYFSSYSAIWTEHARRYAERAVRQLKLTKSSMVLEIASNDGYLLRHFMTAGIPVLGVDPAANVARVAVQSGVPTKVAFFGEAVARRLRDDDGVQADLIVANNVLAHVPHLNDFARGMAMALKPAGAITIEVPHLLRLIDQVQFDTIYHEHYSYFTLLSAERVLAAHGLSVFDVEELPTHGGSLRLWAGHSGMARRASDRLVALRAEERRARLHEAAGYEGFARRVDECRASLTSFLSEAHAAGEMVVGYGAAAKGNTLLNYCGITATDMAYVADRSPHKQGTLLPGSHIPVVHPDHIAQSRPAYVLVLPWNIKDEVKEQMAHIRAWGGRFVIPIPMVSVE